MKLQQIFRQASLTDEAQAMPTFQVGERPKDCLLLAQ